MHSQQRLSIGVIGAGYWGPNLIRTFSSHPRCEIKIVCDLDVSRLQAVAKTDSKITTTTNTKAVLSDPSIHAVVIATPTQTHYSLVKEALENGKHVLVEKPLATTTADCEDLIAIARKKKLQLMVGHVYLFHPAVSYIADFIRSGELGDLVYAYATRTNLGPVRKDVNALWDLAPHDVSIFNYWLGSLPQSVQASGHIYMQAGIEDIAFLTLKYPRNILAHLHVSWLAPRKTREIVLVGTQKMVVFDDLNSENPVQIFDKPITPAISGLTQKGRCPEIPKSEPLMTETHAFIQSIVEGKNSIASATTASAVVSVLEAATRSLKQLGTEIQISLSHDIEMRVPKLRLAA